MNAAGQKFRVLYQSENGRMAAIETPGGSVAVRICGNDFEQVGTHMNLRGALALAQQILDGRSQAATHPTSSVSLAVQIIAQADRVGQLAHESAATGFDWIKLLLAIAGWIESEGLALDAAAHRFGVSVNPVLERVLYANPIDIVSVLKICRVIGFDPALCLDDAADFAGAKVSS